MRCFSTIALSVLALSCTDTPTSTDAGSETDAGALGDAGPLTSCGGFAGETCEADEYCDYPDNICGAADGTGVCRARPTACPENVDPTCACDGQVYDNGCNAASMGVDVNRLGGCTEPADTFACGERFCGTDTYCRVVVDDTGLPPSHECQVFPSPCDGGGRDCTCVANEPCGDMCDDSSGDVTVTCPGG